MEKNREIVLLIINYFKNYKHNQVPKIFELIVSTMPAKIIFCSSKLDTYFIKAVISFYFS